MVAEIVIGNSSDFTVYFGDGVQGAVDTYGVYIKPESIKGYFMTPAAIKSILSLDNISIIQLGAQNVIYRMKGIIIDTFAEFENFKKALTYWAGGNSGATYGGKLLTFQAKDVNGNEWSKIAVYSTPGTLETITVKIIQNVEFEPLPSGKFMIKNLEVIRAKPFEEAADE